MQSKLTLRVDDAVIRKAKLLAQKRGTSVSRIFGDFISSQTKELPNQDFPPLTSSMLGIIRKGEKPIKEDDYDKYREEKYL